MKDRRVRVAIVGVVVIALFSALLGRLWFLQVGGTETGVVVIAQNTLRRIQEESPRGLIVDAHGVVLASDRVAWAVKVDRRLLGKERSLVVSRLSRLTHISIAQINARIKDQRQSPFEPAVVAIGKTEVTDRVRLVILERQENFPHVTVRDRAVPLLPGRRSSRRTCSATSERSAVRPKPRSTRATRTTTPSGAPASRRRTTRTCTARRASRTSRSIPRVASSVNRSWCRPVVRATTCN